MENLNTKIAITYYFYPRLQAVDFEPPAKNQFPEVIVINVGIFGADLEPLILR